MRCTIKKLLLWARDERHEVRSLSFEPDKVNLVTGPSRTGKSAITYIIDYVLGSKKCAIPIGEIRDTVAWYGLLLDVDGNPLLVAREDPGPRIGSDNYFMDERDDASIPARPSKNTNRASFKTRMNLLTGLPNLDFAGGEGYSGFSARPSFRDMAAFNFLPQHVVANPYTLFFKADTTEHRLKLRTIFPFVLGAVSVEHLAAEHEQSELEKQLRRIKSELHQRNRAAESWKAEAFGLHGRAVALGLLPQDASRPSSLTDCLRDLAAIPETVSTDTQLPVRTPGSTLAEAQRLEEVRANERSTDRKLGELRIRLQRIRGLQGAVEDFGGAAAGQSGRVLGVGWLAKRLKDGAACPLCGTDHEGAQTKLQQLASAAEDLAHRQRMAGETPVILHREQQELQSEIRNQESILQELRVERRELESRRAQRGGQSLEEVFRFVGRIEEAIGNITQTEDGSALASEKLVIENRLAELRVILDPRERHRRLGAALQLFSRNAAHYAEFLGLERADDAIDLNLHDLTLVFTSQSEGRKDYLWEIGSGANWMGYHLATMLSLHQLFLENLRSPVPTFLVIDQPSQVYFPAGYQPTLGDSSDDKEPADIIATRRIFEALSEGLRRLDHRVQVIVTEHADNQTIGVLPSLHVVADWHRGARDYLIPRAWLEHDESAG
jgi:hypothetical protein